jgi:hypothetical protein
MINHENFNDKSNFREVWLRNVLIGFLGYMKNRINWVNEFDSGPVDVNIPFYGALSGNGRFVLDAFKDDMSIDRIDMNTDTIPRGAVYFKSWSFVQDNFTNPNIWINHQIEIDDELKEISSLCKMLPMKISAHIDIILDSEIDVMKAWESLMTSLFIYKYFTYEFKRLPINANFVIPTDMENPIVREKTFGDASSKSVMTVPLDIDIYTVFPIFDYENSINSNNQVEWILQLWNQNKILSTTRDVIYTPGVPPQ